MTEFEDPKRRLLELQAQRDALEIEAEAIVGELNSPGPKGEPAVGLKGPLVDKEGFPRADVDIYRARTLRHRLAVVSTDHKGIMRDIENALKELHASYNLPTCEELEKQREQAMVDSPPPAATTSHSTSAVLAALSLKESAAAVEAGGMDLSKCKAIAIVDQILDGSPAQSAGLCDGDRLIAFGSVTSSACANPLAEVPAVVKECYGRISANKTSGGTSPYIPVVVQRSDEQIRLQLVPATWTGRGLLGCHLTPIY